ncbi:SLC13 family permease [Athalassotoga saccharophila]|uniref:SLC13 family permease n=1 Tax=Athalassotoga saccharophila TaxID=1441386 RepID=UPI00137B885E|nr:SLC13 family permease [Athalassotoga saccharophila]BBJ27629.1 citrate transporter [Athalassotoga saccharophila]
MKIIQRLSKEWLFLISSAAAILTIILVKENPLKFIGYDQIRVLWILFIMMMINGGLKQKGVLDYWGFHLISRSKNTLVLSIMLLILTAILAPLVTNDVTLIVIVPLTVSVAQRSEFDPMWLVILESVVANGMSSFTPFGNPQNIYIYTHYNAPPLEFMGYVAIFSLLSLAVAIFTIFFIRNKSITKVSRITKLEKQWWVYLLLLLLMIASILRFGDIFLIGGFILAYIILADRRLLGSVDYFLLGTFVAFFILSGEISSMSWLKNLPEFLNSGKNVFLTSALLSQIISNVPSAIVISAFTNLWKPLLLGVSVGGFGTLVGSLANIIAFSIYKRNFKSNYLKYFHLYSIPLFLGMLLFFSFV